MSLPHYIEERIEDALKGRSRGLSVRTILTGFGHKGRGKYVIERIRAELAERGVELDPPLDWPGLNQEAVVKFVPCGQAEFAETIYVPEYDEPELPIETGTEPPRYLTQDPSIAGSSNPDVEEPGDEIEMDDETQEEVERDSDPSLGDRPVLTQSLDPTIKDLFDRFKEGDLRLQPEFQRYFVWDRAKSSRLIESVLMDVPLPIVYLAEGADGTEEVIDGQQRLTSFFNFLDGKFALGGLQIKHEINGYRYTQLAKEHQTKIRRMPIRTVTVKKESPENLKFEIFQRLNTGSVALNDQELRNCVYSGPYNELVRSLAAEPDFKKLLGIIQPDKRMRDVELVLRFLAFHHATYLKYKPPIKEFLNADARLHRMASKAEQDKLRDLFKASAALTLSLLGDHAFKRFYRGNQENPQGHWEPKKFNASLYDILMWGFTQHPKNLVMSRLDSIREALIWLMTEDQEFIDAIELSTSSVKAVQTRFDKWRMALKAAMADATTQPRCFSLALKKELFVANPTCMICMQSIQLLDDAAVDHIDQYWNGGKTIPENARLTHRYCNWARPRVGQ